MLLSPRAAALAGPLSRLAARRVGGFGSAALASRPPRSAGAPLPASAAAASSSSSAAAAAAAAAAAEAPGAMLEVVRVPALSDNYIWLVREPRSGATAVVDPAEVAPVEAELKKRGWPLHFVLNTHHHGDHVGGNLELKKRHAGLQVVGPRADAARIPGIDVQLGDGDAWKLGDLEMRVFDTPGHTRGHITLWFPEAAALFPGDTLFALGCGRLFEGDPPTMWASLSKLTGLPRDTRVYCAHEYTASNARFAVAVNPSNAALTERKARVDEARAKGEATVPSLLGEELDTNPFLRPQDPEIRASVGAAPGAPDWDVFGAVRRAKDGFRG
ncbi:hydroxyacylglutathione hydrolase [Raphidocelis subcapitata]|uniref:hydroxyacylglutathione hydrolase n=1 Tax=Raphidocelis subcapitata TaxID=307507 RepID=A0A2V0P7J0_9CHLO|nr:hydroxyacylglutathione hydrolase [Raphidocelis subcapitata]|eukprot:GBF93843.1 hydroxyacylglutathione hydrolase [Raphidocelis subcapitata]